MRFDIASLTRLSYRAGILIVAGLLAACAPMPAPVEVETAVAPAHDEFAAKVPYLNINGTSVMASPYGTPSEVTAGDFYTSALGQQCRPVKIRASGVVHRLAVCNGENGWYTVAPIFEALPR